MCYAAIVTCALLLMNSCLLFTTQIHSGGYISLKTAQDTASGSGSALMPSLYSPDYIVAVFLSDTDSSGGVIYYE